MKHWACSTFEVLLFNQLPRGLWPKERYDVCLDAVHGVHVNNALHDGTMMFTVQMIENAFRFLEITHVTHVGSATLEHHFILADMPWGKNARAQWDVLTVTFNYCDWVNKAKR